MADLQCQDLLQGVPFDVLLLYNGSSHTGSDVMAPDQADKELGLGIAVTLCAFLESRSLAVFLPCRDGQPGMCKFDSMVESLQSSKVVVVVLTPGFQHSYWESFKQKYALADLLDAGRPWCLIPVCFGHPRQTLPSCLKNCGVTWLPVEGWERDCTSLDLLLDRVALAVRAVDEKTSPHRLIRADLRGSLTPSPLPCPPPLCETTPCHTQTLPEDTPTQEVERTRDLSDTILKVPVTPPADSTGGGSVESLFHLPGKMYLGIRRLYSRLASREESTEPEPGEQKEEETLRLRSLMTRSITLNFLHSLLSTNTLPPTQDLDS